MKTEFDLSANPNVTVLGALLGVAVGTCLVIGIPHQAAGPVTVAKPAAQAVAAAPAVASRPERALLRGTTRGSYFWDDASGRRGDTGLPAIGSPMRKGLFASPSWPLGTEGYIIYKGKKAPFFVGDRGPGAPSEDGVMLDIDGQTFAELTGNTWNSDTLTVSGGQGHITVDYVVTKWGDGPGRRGAPVPYGTGAWKS